jgi:hypothetical protein
MERQDREVLLLIDNAPSHIYDASKLTHVTVAFLEPNMTSRIQPLDAGIIRAWKAQYRRLYIRSALERDDAGEENIWKIDQLQGMRLAERAWSLIVSSTIVNCWRHSGIISPRGPDGWLLPETNTVEPDGPLVDDMVTAVEDALKKDLAQLKGRCVAERNLMSLEEVLADTEEEKTTEEEWTDEMIVVQTKADFEEPAPVADSGSSSDDEDPPLITHTQALKSVLELERLARVSEGPEYEGIIHAFPPLKRRLRMEITASKVQATLTDRFLAPSCSS